MSARLVQLADKGGERRVGLVEGARARILDAPDTVYELALEAIAAARGLAEASAARAGSETVDLDAVEAAGRLLAPLDHPDPAHMLVSGTGLTHLGSAESRDKMHRTLEGEAPLSDSMKMFKLGIEGGKPEGGPPGAQPEWFYKGDGSILAAPGAELALPDYALDGGEESEIVGLYVIAPDGTPWRLGFALGNEFSDHVMERQNYLNLAHSKLRACAFGPELRLGALPADLTGRSRILRDGRAVWEAAFLSGEDNMCHSLANLEYHHFKYDRFRRPGDVHAHFFGTSTLSFSAGFKPAPGDTFEIEMPGFGRPLRNTLARREGPVPAVRAL